MEQPDPGREKLEIDNTLEIAVVKAYTKEGFFGDVAFSSGN